MDRGSCYCNIKLNTCLTHINQFSRSGQWILAIRTIDSCLSSCFYVLNKSLYELTLNCVFATPGETFIISVHQHTLHRCKMYSASRNTGQKNEIPLEYICNDKYIYKFILPVAFTHGYMVRVNRPEDVSTLWWLRPICQVRSGGFCLCIATGCVKAIFLFNQSLSYLHI